MHESIDVYKDDRNGFSEWKVRDKEEIIQTEVGEYTKVLKF